MNNLSWLIYWADAAPSLANFACVLGFLLFALSLSGTIGYLVTAASYRKITAFDNAIAAWRNGPTDLRGKEPKSYDDAYRINSDDRGFAVWHPNFKVFPFLTPLFFLMWGGSFLVPSKDTFYLIAASEAGEQALQTPEFGKVRQVINKWLDGQLHDEPDSNIQ